MAKFQGKGKRDDAETFDAKDKNNGWWLVGQEKMNKDKVKG